MEKEVFLRQLHAGETFRWQGLDWVVVNENGLSYTCMIINLLPCFQNISLKFPLGSKRNFFRRMLYSFFCDNFSDMEDYVLASKIDIPNLNIYDRLVIFSPEQFTKYEKIIQPYLLENEKVWTCQEESDRYIVLKKENEYFTSSLEDEYTRANIYPVAKLGGAIKVEVEKKEEPLMTPEDFYEVSKDFLTRKLSTKDEEQAIRIMTDLLKKLGYEEGVRVLKYVFDWK